MHRTFAQRFNVSLLNGAERPQPSVWILCVCVSYVAVYSFTCEVRCFGLNGPAFLNASDCQTGSEAGGGGAQEVAAWEGRGAFLYHVDVHGDIAAQTLTLAHLAHIWCRAGFTFSLVRARVLCNSKGVLCVIP